MQGFAEQHRIISPATKDKLDHACNSMSLQNQPVIELVQFVNNPLHITAVRQAVFVTELGIDPALNRDTQGENFLATGISQQNMILLADTMLRKLQ